MAGLSSFTSTFVHDEWDYGWSHICDHYLGTEHVSVTLWDENGHHVLPLRMQTQSANSVAVEIGSNLDRARSGLEEVDNDTKISVTVIG